MEDSIKRKIKELNQMKEQMDEIKDDLMVKLKEQDIKYNKINKEIEEKFDEIQTELLKQKKNAVMDANEYKKEMHQHHEKLSNDLVKLKKLSKETMDEREYEQQRLNEITNLFDDDNVEGKERRNKIIEIGEDVQNRYNDHYEEYKEQMDGFQTENGDEMALKPLFVDRKSCEKALKYIKKMARLRQEGIVMQQEANNEIIEIVEENENENGNKNNDILKENNLSTMEEQTIQNLKDNLLDKMGQIEKYEKIEKSLRQEIAAKDSQIRLILQQKDELDEAKLTLKREMKNFENKLVTKEEAMKIKENNNKQLIKEKEKLMKQLHDMEVKYAQNKENSTEREAQLAQLMMKKDKTMNKKYDELLREKNALKQNLEKLMKNKLTLDQIQRSLIDEKKENKALKDEIYALHGSLEEQGGIQQTMEAEIEKLKQQKKKKSRDVKRLEMELKEQKEKEAEGENWEAVELWGQENEKLREKIKELVRERDGSAKQRKKDLKDCMVQISDLQFRIKGHDGKLRQKDDEIRRLRTEINGYKKRGLQTKRNVNHNGNVNNNVNGNNNLDEMKRKQSHNNNKRNVNGNSNKGNNGNDSKKKKKKQKQESYAMRVNVIQSNSDSVKFNGNNGEAFIDALCKRMKYKKPKIDERMVNIDKGQFEWNCKLELVEVGIIQNHKHKSKKQARYGCYQKLANKINKQFRI